MTEQLTYKDCSPMLRELGYATGAVRDGFVHGPWPVAQLDHAQFARDGDGVAVMCACPPPRGPAPWVIDDHVSTWLATISVSVRGPAVADVVAIIERFATGAPVRVIDGTRVYVFRTAERLPELSARIGGDSVSVEQSFIELGSPNDWPRGDLLSTARNALPELSNERAHELVAAIKEVLYEHAPLPTIVQPPKHVPATERSIALERDNTSAIVDALFENGYAAVTLPWGDEPPRRQSTEPMRPPAVALYLRAPSTSRFSFTGSRNIQHTSLCSVTVKAGPKVANEVDAVLERFIGGAKRCVRVNADGSKLFLFRHEPLRGHMPFDVKEVSRSRRYADFTGAPGTHTSVEVACKERAVTVLGDGIAWDGPLKIRRAELAELDGHGAEALINAIKRLLDEPQPAEPSVVERLKRAVRGR